jgi:hypothetical protein
MKSLRQDKKKLYKIRTSLLTHYYLSPTNILQEKIKFFKDNKYNPRFHYPLIPANKLKKYEEDINKFGSVKINKFGSVKINKFVSDEIEGFCESKSCDISNFIYKRRLKETRLKLKLLLSIGTSSLLEVSESLYQLKFKREIIESAKKDAAVKTFSKQSKIMGRDEIVKVIKNYLMKYGIKNWKIILTNRHDFTFQILPKSKLIKIGISLNSHLNNLEYSLAHEIDVHVLRAQNAAKQKRKIYRNLFPFYIKTEEGLACYIGDHFSSGGEVKKKQHAISYLAAYFAKNHSFSETYKYLTDQGITPDAAFQKTFRLKRGVVDSEAPGVFAREAIYYEGMIEVKNYLEKSGDIRKLYAGKVGLADVNIIPVPDDQIIPKRITSLLN